MSEEKKETEWLVVWMATYGRDNHHTVHGNIHITDDESDKLTADDIVCIKEIIKKRRPEFFDTDDENDSPIILNIIKLNG